MSPACLGEFRAARVPHSPPGGSSGAKVRGSGLRAQAEEEPLSRVSTSVSFPRGAGHEEGRQRARLQAMGWVPPAVGAAVVAGERQAGRSPPEGEGRSKRDGTGRDGTERNGREGRRESGCWYLWGEEERGGGKAQRQQQQAVRVEDLFRSRLTRPPRGRGSPRCFFVRLSVDAVRPVPVAAGGERERGSVPPNATANGTALLSAINPSQPLHLSSLTLPARVVESALFLLYFFVFIFYAQYA
jgi:hypothetical protein